MAMTGGISVLLHTGIPNYGSATKRPVKLYAYYKSVQNQENNKSTVYVGMYVVVPSAYYIGPWADYNGSYIGTTSNTFDGSIAKSSGTVWLAQDKTLTVPHNSDGTAKATIYWRWGVNSPWGQFENESGSFQITLPTIPRASEIGASDANIGAKSTIIVNRKSTAYTHSIAYKFGSLTGYVTESGGVSSTEVKYSASSISWTIPTAFYAQIPNSKTGTCTLTIKTYSGSTQIGDAKTGTFTVTASKTLCAPNVSGTVVDSNATTKALTGNKNKLVRYYSNALCTITATAKNSATISTKKIGDKTVSGNTRSIRNIEVDAILFRAVDSRGYASSVEVEFELIPYVPITSNPEATRVDPGTGVSTLRFSGNYFNGSFGSKENALTIKYSIDGSDYISVEPIISGNQYSANIEISGLDYRAAHTAEVIVSDLLDTVTKTITIGKSIPPFYWNENLFGLTTNIVAGNFIKTGILKIKPTAADTPTYGEVVFDSPFSGVPHVSVGVVTTSPGTSVKGVGISSVKASGFKIYLTGPANVATSVHWIAVYQPTNPL